MGNINTYGLIHSHCHQFLELEVSGSPKNSKFWKRLKPPQAPPPLTSPLYIPTYIDCGAAVHILRSIAYLKVENFYTFLNGNDVFRWNTCLMSVIITAKGNKGASLSWNQISKFSHVWIKLNEKTGKKNSRQRYVDETVRLILIDSKQFPLHTYKNSTCSFKGDRREIFIGAKIINYFNDILNRIQIM